MLRMILIALALARRRLLRQRRRAVSGRAGQDVAKRFHEALVAGRPVAAAAARARAVPLQGRRSASGRDAATVEKNLAKEIPRIQHLLGGPRPHRGVFARRPPRGPVAARTARSRRTSSRAEVAGRGSRARTVARPRLLGQRRPGYMLVLNQDGPTAWRCRRSTSDGSAQSAIAAGSASTRRPRPATRRRRTWNSLFRAAHADGHAVAHGPREQEVGERGLDLALDRAPELAAARLAPPAEVDDRALDRRVVADEDAGALGDLREVARASAPRSGCCRRARAC